jgi:hypothetical protein
MHVIFPFQPANGYCGPRLTGHVSVDAFVTKFDPSGSNVIYSTYLGGFGHDEGYGIAADEMGNAYVTGMASYIFPTTANAYLTANGSGGFVTKFNPSGSALVYSTHLVATSGNFGRAVALDDSGNAYVTGSFGVLKLNPAGSALVYSLSWGGPVTRSRLTLPATHMWQLALQPSL